MADIDYSKLSDEELERIAGGQDQPNVDLSKMSDAELEAMANQPAAKESAPHIPPVVAGGAAAYNVGIPAAELVGGATLAKGAYDLLKKKGISDIAQGVRNFAGATPAQKWNEKMHGVDLPQGEMDKASFDLGQRMKQTIGPGGELQGGSVRGGIMIGPEATKQLAAEEAALGDAELKRQANRTVRQKMAEGWNITKEKVTPQNDVAKLLLKKPLTAAKIIPGTFGAGYNAADLYNRAMEGNIPQAAISTAGTVGSIASMLPHKKAGRYGAAAAIGAPVVNAAIDYFKGAPESVMNKAEGGVIAPHLEHMAKGGAVQHFAGGKLVDEGANIAKKGYEFVKGYLESTPKKPNPLVGTRYETKNVVDLIPIKPGKIEDIKGAVVQSNPWDDTSRGVEVHSVSGKRLTKPVETHGGQPYVRDPEHARQNIGGASGRGIATRVQNRANEGSIEGLNLGGSGEVILMPSTMGQFSGNFAKPTWEIYNDLFKQAEPNKQTIRELSDRMRSTKIRGRMPFEFAPDLMTEDAARVFENNPDFRKAFVQMMQLKNNQKLLGVNAEDISNAMADPNLLGVPRGFVGHTGIEMVPGAELRPSTNVSYDTDWLGKYRLSLPHTPMQVMLKRRYDEILPEIQAMYPNKTPAQLDAMTLGALETRSKGVSELMDEEAINRIGQYHEGLKQGAFAPYDVGAAMEYLNKPGRYADGGRAKVNKLKGGLGMLPMSARTELRQRGQLADRQGIPAAMAMPDQAMVAAYNSAPADIAKLAAMYANPMVGAGMGGGQMLQAASQGDVGDAALMGGLGMLGAAGQLPRGIRAARGVANTMMQNPRAPSMMDRLYQTGSPDEHLQAIPAMAGGGDVVKSLIKKTLGAADNVGSRAIEGSPHTYPPIAEGPWMRDYQPAARPEPKIAYMGKYVPQTQENYMIQKNVEQQAIRDAMNQRKAQWIARSKQLGMSDQQIADEIAHSFGDYPWMP